MTPEEIDLTLATGHFADTPHALYHALRRISPVHWSSHESQWLVTSYQHMEEVLSQPDVFSSVGAETAHVERLDRSARTITPHISDHFSTPQLNISDPPDHTRFRRVVNRPFLARQVAPLEPVVADITRRLLERGRSPAGTVDVVASLAEPLPVDVIGRVIGIPESFAQTIRQVSLHQREFFGTTPPEPVQAQHLEDSLIQWHELLTGWMDSRRAEPADDVLTVMAHAVDQGKMTSGEAIATCLHLVIAGNSTTTALIGNVVYALVSHPDQLERVEGDPSLLENAVEETLRCEPPLPRDRRIAAVDYELGGRPIRRGDRVSVVLAAANRDPDQFPNPDRFDIGRSFATRHHVSFGRGIHFCLGAALARLETVTAIRTLLEVVPRPRMMEGFAPEWHDVKTHHGLKELLIESSLSLV